MKLGFIWTAVAIACIFIVKFTKIGPIVYSISIEHGWGVHSGDLLALIPILMGVVGTVFLKRKRATV